MNSYSIGRIAPDNQIYKCCLDQAIKIKNTVWSITLLPDKDPDHMQMEIYGETPTSHPIKMANDIAMQIMPKFGRLERNESVHIIMSNSTLLMAFCKKVLERKRLEVTDFTYGDTVSREVTNWIFLDLGWVPFVEAGGHLELVDIHPFTQEQSTLYNLSWDNGSCVMKGKNKLH